MGNSLFVFVWFSPLATFNGYFGVVQDTSNISLGWRDDLQHEVNSGGDHRRHVPQERPARRASDGGRETEADGLRWILPDGSQGTGQSDSASSCFKIGLFHQACSFHLNLASAFVSFALGTSRQFLRRSLNPGFRGSALSIIVLDDSRTEFGCLRGSLKVRSDA